MPGTMLLPQGIMVDQTGFQTWFGRRLQKSCSVPALSLDLKTLCSFSWPLEICLYPENELGLAAAGRVATWRRASSSPSVSQLTL